MRNVFKYLTVVTIILVFAFYSNVAAKEQNWGPTVVAETAGKAPVLDGKTDEWQQVPVVKVMINSAVSNDPKNFTGSVEVELRAVTNADMIYFLAQWPDSTKDATHKTLHWDKEKEAYVGGKDREDRLALRFDMGGDYATCMLAGTEYKADSWHWKAYRSQSAGFVHDKMHIFSIKQIPLAKQHPSKKGDKIWVARPSDSGGKLYKSQRPIDYIGDTVPRYIVNKNVTGSIADIKSAAVWKNGKWTLELSRKLDTGHDDDVKFEKGKTYRAGAAVFNHTGDNHHSIGAFVLRIK